MTVRCAVLNLLQLLSVSVVVRPVCSEPPSLLGFLVQPLVPDRYNPSVQPRLDRWGQSREHS